MRFYPLPLFSHLHIALRALEINLPRTDLPVEGIIDDVRNHLTANNRLVVSAPPGAGKSTLLPLALLRSEWLNGKKIIILEPRRLAARSIAYRMADLLGEPVGETVGYRIRFETKISDRTQIEVVTEGILTRMLQSDNALEDTGLVIFDEYHERSIHADLTLALCLEAQQVIRPDLRLLVMSATLNMEALESLLNTTSIVSTGRQYPVDIVYTGQSDMRMIPELTARIINRAINEQKGDILAFFPGEGEIRRCETLLKNELKGISIHALYGKLPQKQQLEAIFPNKQGKRKVVLATSIAETSLTIEGIDTVVDTGFGRGSVFNPATGLSRLETYQISKDKADQRAGRAGRLRPGVCYRMWTKATHENLPSFSTPEIMEADLSSLILELANWGITDPGRLVWLDQPPAGHVAQAKELLTQLSALDHDRITPHGKKLLTLPCHPRIAHMLVEAGAMDLSGLATDVAALIEERDPMPDAGIDLTVRMDTLRRFRSENRVSGGFKRIEKVASSYRSLLNLETENDPVDPFEVGLILSLAYPERIACARPGNNARFQLANGSYAMVGHQDDLAHEPWLAVAALNARAGEGKIFLAAPVNPKDLAPYVKEREVITWDKRKGSLIASKDLTIGNIVLRSTPLPNPDPAQLKNAILTAVKKSGEQLLNFTEDVTQWQLRVLSLRKWNNTVDWPDVSTPSLLLDAEQWLAPYLDHVTTADDLKRLDLQEILHHSLPYEQQTMLDQLAPKRIEVPSGSSLKLEYRENGEPPLLKVRIQELFGLSSTPAINEGRQKLLIDLLSPGFKPVQRTDDLQNFWNVTYFEVRKELKRRYPKHSWPDDPWTAEAVRGVKRRSD